MKLNHLLLSIVVITIGCSSPQGVSEQPIEANEEVKSEEPPKGYLIPGMEHGLVQSPINILSSRSEDGMHNITLNFNGEINRIENLGHTVQLDFEPGNTITADGITYEFKQIHFHTPSEHMIDGITYPMEAHIVNMKENEGGTPDYLVISLLFKMGAENNFIKKFIDEIPNLPNSTRSIDLNAVKESQLSDNVEKVIQECYHYKGSLTTPPYTESVYWLVHKEIFEASPEQIRTINEIEGDNARHIQAINDRKIEAE
jgi:carbonic anhydrase